MNSVAERPYLSFTASALLDLAHENWEDEQILSEIRTELKNHRTTKLSQRILRDIQERISDIDEERIANSATTPDDQVAALTDVMFQRNRKIKELHVENKKLVDKVCVAEGDSVSIKNLESGKFTQIKILRKTDTQLPSPPELVAATSPQAGSLIGEELGSDCQLGEQGIRYQISRIQKEDGLVLSMG